MSELHWNYALRLTFPRVLEEVIETALFELEADGWQSYPPLDENSELSILEAYAETLELAEHWQSEFVELFESLGPKWQSLYRVELRDVDLAAAQLEFAKHLKASLLTSSLAAVPLGQETPAGFDGIFLHPAFAFGFGEDPTTQLASLELEKLSAENQLNHVLDVGCGTGILSFVAAKLGAKRIVGIDNDPIAIEAAEANAALNITEASLEFTSSELSSLSETYPLVIANIQPRVLVELSELIANSCSEGGTLVLTGFIDESRSELLDVYGKLGFEFRSERDIERWKLLRLVKNR